MTKSEMLDRLVRAGNRFRNTPIVDDDFPAMRDEFDRLLVKATELVESSPWMRRQLADAKRDAFRAGAEAMKASCVAECKCSYGDGVGQWDAEKISDYLSNLPLPEPPEAKS